MRVFSLVTSTSMSIPDPTLWAKTATLPAPTILIPDPHPQRAANVDAVAPCVLWKLDRQTFTHIVAGAAAEKRKRYEQFLSEVPLLRNANSYERSQIADALKTEKFAAGANIITEGEAGNSFYILEAGRFSVRLIDVRCSRHVLKVADSCITCPCAV